METDERVERHCTGCQHVSHSQIITFLLQRLYASDITFEQSISAHICCQRFHPSNCGPTLSAVPAQLHTEHSNIPFQAGLPAKFIHVFTNSHIHLCLSENLLLVCDTQNALL